MLVGVSMNITNAPTTGVVGVTYNGVRPEFCRRSQRRRKYATASKCGTCSLRPQVPITFWSSVNIPGAQTVGVVAGVTTFTGADQTVPLGTFVSADGAAGTNSSLDVPSVVNGQILDTLAVGGDRTVAIPSPQVSQWNQVSSGVVDPPDVTGVAALAPVRPACRSPRRLVAPPTGRSEPCQINPSTADIGVSTSVTAVPLGQNSTYNITIKNNGPSAANNVISDRHLRRDRIGDRVGDAQRWNDLCDRRDHHLHASR